MKIYNLNSLAEVERLKPSIVLIMAKVNQSKGRSWCGDTNRALENIKKMKEDPKFLWHTLALVEVGYRDWKSYVHRHPNSKATFAHSRLQVDRVPTLLKWKDPYVKLVEDQMYWENEDLDGGYGYRHIEYMLLTGGAPTEYPIYMNIEYVFKPLDIEQTNPSVVYFKGIYNPGYGKSWHSGVNKDLHWLG